MPKWIFPSLYFSKTVLLSWEQHDVIIIIIIYMEAIQCQETQTHFFTVILYKHKTLSEWGVKSCRTSLGFFILLYLPPHPFCSCFLPAHLSAQLTMCSMLSSHSGHLVILLNHTIHPYIYYWLLFPSHYTMWLSLLKSNYFYNPTNIQENTVCDSILKWNLLFLVYR